MQGYVRFAEFHRPGTMVGFKISFIFRDSTAVKWQCRRK